MGLAQRMRRRGRREDGGVSECLLVEHVEAAEARPKRGEEESEEHDKCCLRSEMIAGDGGDSSGEEEGEEVESAGHIDGYRIECGMVAGPRSPGNSSVHGAAKARRCLYQWAYGVLR
ncbi:hypothetical protein AXG93_1440s1010 [Marchantia polymorpha subsp. ruderalis]|uniref:Uncharacterized protein n=1 Tax=Marchantia polymorpha subsp. ruderalis TaxID=1480154 RepID=A0A176W3K5_MARPO|nr:hypothetical protein AXG93_1440s1010 [Marchantia polymorpha subsp. ruderalis]